MFVYIEAPAEERLRMLNHCEDRCTSRFCDPVYANSKVYDARSIIQGYADNPRAARHRLLEELNSLSERAQNTYTLTKSADNAFIEHATKMLVLFILPCAVIFASRDDSMGIFVAVNMLGHVGRAYTGTAQMRTLLLKKQKSQAYDLLARAWAWSGWLDRALQCLPPMIEHGAMMNHVMPILDLVYGYQYPEQDIRPSVTKERSIQLLTELNTKYQTNRPWEGEWRFGEILELFGATDKDIECFVGFQYGSALTYGPRCI